MTLAAPPGFPKTGNGLWYNSTGSIWSRRYLPLGNGYLAAMTSGGSVQEITQLNIESLWAGGPFSNTSYNGANKLPSERQAMADATQSYRTAIFSAENGSITNVDDLTESMDGFGSYAGAGYLLSTIFDASKSAVQVESFGRFLDIDEGRAIASWSRNGDTFVRETFCSYVKDACLQNTTTSSSLGFSQTVTLASEPGFPPANVTCVNNETLRLDGMVSNPGMRYEILAAVLVSPGGSVSCFPIENVNGTGYNNATVIVENATSATVAWVGGTNYDMNAGDTAHNFSFAGPDPHEALSTILPTVTKANYDDLLAEHVRLFRDTLYSSFALDLGQEPNLETPTDTLRAAYVIDEGDRYIEWLLFNYGRYMLASSARGRMPANLQGKWADGASNAWQCDYHPNINLEMSYWIAETTDLNVTQSLFDYMEKTWVPRGTYTAQVLYDIDEGWVNHIGMNTFGGTGMYGGSDSAEWADNPDDNAWMMMNVWDHFDFTNDVAWWKSQGYPLLKGVAQFHLQKLIPDAHFNDGTLVVTPCNSPEQPPVTFGCSHSQQIIWQVFNAIEKGAGVAGETDSNFLGKISETKSQMDKGIHIGSWGQLQEWKVDMDAPNDTHRHLSHLVGLYPGYALSNFNSSLQVDLTNKEVIDAVTTSLIHRGNGTGPDADAGWEKAWRAACWAQLGNATEFFHELSYLIQRNFAENLFSIYDPADDDPVFQIDANLGYPAAVMNALLQAVDAPDLSIPLVINILPSLPNAWQSGELKGARVRGGLGIDISWDEHKPTRVSVEVKSGFPTREVRIVYEGSTVLSFTITGDLATYDITHF